MSACARCVDAYMHADCRSSSFNRNVTNGNLERAVRKVRARRHVGVPPHGLLDISSRMGQCDTGNEEELTADAINSK